MKPAEATNEVGVVVLNYNCHDFLETCIQSVLDQTYKGIAIWIVDNGSTDDSVELVRNRFADMPLIEIKSNRGFFFSSRRRHTRSDRDWSSDVCSSDLSVRGVRKPGPGRRRGGRAGDHDDRYR